MQMTTTGSTKHGDLATFRGTVESVMGSYYPQLVDRVAVRAVACPAFTAEALALLSSLSPYGTADGDAGVGQPALVPLLATRSPHYDDVVTQAIARANQVSAPYSSLSSRRRLKFGRPFQVYRDFTASEEGQGFAGDVYVIGDAMGGILAFDAVLREGKAGLSRNPSQVRPPSRSLKPLIYGWK